VDGSAASGGAVSRVRAYPALVLEDYHQADVVLRLANRGRQG
jgi:hypothetical protein